ncbi:MAG: hypothetical protein ACRDJF_10410 [Actinomycetota bacterium]
MMKVILVALFVPTMLLGIAGDADAVVIEGSVTNGTAGASVPPGLTVTAVQLDGGGNELSRKPAPVGADGRFRLDGFGDEPSSRYVIGLGYRGVTYARSLAVESPIPIMTADLTIYEVTEDDAGISVSADTLTVVQGGKGEMEVFQLLRVRNSTDRTYIGRAVEGGRQILTLPVPTGAFDLAPGQAVTASAITSSPEGIATGDPVFPGETQLSYLYRVRTPRTGWALERAVVYPTTRLNVLVGEGLKLRAPRLAFAESVKLKQRRYRRYQGGPLPAGGELIASVEPDTRASSSLPMGLGALLALVLAVAFGGSRLLRPGARWGARGRGARSGRREQIIEEIAALDEAFAGGKIRRARYEKKRPRLKRRLAAMAPGSTSRSP